MPKILAIDDIKNNLVALATLLKNLMPDCDISTALSGAEGLLKARTDLPDVILLDVNIPDMDGFETCRQLKGGEDTESIPVIMLTASKTTCEYRIEGMEAGADAFLSKPIDDAELLCQVRIALRVKKAEDSLRKQRNSLRETVEEQTGDLLREIAAHKIAEEKLLTSESVLNEMGRSAQVGW